jgi:apolipoprotein N-acyltransferase
VNLRARKATFAAVGLVSLTAILLSLISDPINLSILAWVALVPFLLACRPEVGMWKLAATALIISFFYWVGNLYWLWYVTPAGYLGLSVYLGVYWAVLAISVRFCRIKQWPLTLAVPILWVGAETIQGSFTTGFGWRFLSHSQYLSTSLIQISDIFGSAGVSFLVAMVNGLFADLILGYINGVKITRINNLIKTAAIGSCVAGAFLYGKWRINQIESSVRKGPLVASVQSNVPLEVKESKDASEEIFIDLMRQSDMASETNPVLIIWPETMVQAVLSPELQDLLAPNTRQRVFDRLLKEHTKNNSNLLVGAMGGDIKIEGERIKLKTRYNSAYLYTEDGNQYSGRYDKMHLVPFGEVVPFKKSIPWFHNLLMEFTPYDYDYTLDYGENYTVFKVAKDNKPYNFGVLICYEDSIPYVARNFMLDQNGKKRVDWLVNISNDGWFVRFANSKVMPSTELGQHAAVCVFRAVENRVPIIRSVNTGISCLIDSTGRIRDGFAAGTMPQKAMDRKALAGWFADHMPIDTRVTFYSHYGQWLDFSCAFLFSAVVITQFILLKRSRGASNKNDTVQKVTTEPSSGVQA